MTNRSAVFLCPMRVGSSISSPISLHCIYLRQRQWSPTATTPAHCCCGGRPTTLPGIPNAGWVLRAMSLDVLANRGPNEKLPVSLWTTEARWSRGTVLKSFWEIARFIWAQGQRQAVRAEDGWFSNTGNYQRVGFFSVEFLQLGPLKCSGYFDCNIIIYR